MLLHRLDKPLAELRVAVVTPTFERRDYLAQTLRYFRNQLHGVAETRWFVLDDSASRAEPPSFAAEPDVHYEWRDARMTLGAKRNELNRLALDWGADVVCSMDDDDWYGPGYLRDMCELLLAGDACFAGSGADYYYDVRSGRILFIDAVRAHSSCNGVLCYKAAVLPRRSYDDQARAGEEPAFIGRDEVLQHPDVKQVHLALAHTGNTVSKRNYLIDPACRTSLGLDDLPMEEADKAFYRALTARA